MTKKELDCIIKYLTNLRNSHNTEGFKWHIIDMICQAFEEIRKGITVGKHKRNKKGNIADITKNL